MGDEGWGGACFSLLTPIVCVYKYISCAFLKIISIFSASVSIFITVFGKPSTISGKGAKRQQTDHIKPTKKDSKYIFFCVCVLRGWGEGVRYFLCIIFQHQCDIDYCDIYRLSNYRQATGNNHKEHEDHHLTKRLCCRF